MNILAIDLGETTGYALLSNETLLKHGTCTDMDFRGLPIGQPDLVVIERPAYVHSRMQGKYEVATHLLRVAYRNVKVVRPADWMPRFNHYPLPGRDVLKTQHEKDSFRMAHWALEKFKP